MDILHVTREVGGDARYGIRKSLMPVLEALRLHGHRVTLFDQEDAFGMPSGKAMQWAEARYLASLRRRFRPEGELALNIVAERIRVARAAAAYAARHKISHVHCHDPLLARAYAFFAPLYGATRHWGYSAHAYGRFVQLRLGVETSADSLAYLQNWEAWAASKAHWVIALSNSGLQQMAADLGLPGLPAHWRVVPHAVALPTLGERGAARQALGLDAKVKLLLAVGQLIPLKRFSLLLEAVALLPSDLRPHVLLLGDGGEQAALQALAESLGLGERFEIRVTDNIGQYLAAADIYASVSSTESFGMANCEALLAGVPAICTAVGAVAEIVGDAALLVDGQAAEIASALARLLTSEAECDALRAKARRRVAEWPGIDEIAAKLEHIYARQA